MNFHTFHKLSSRISHTSKNKSSWSGRKRRVLPSSQIMVSMLWIMENTQTIVRSALFYSYLSVKPQQENICKGGKTLREDVTLFIKVMLQHALCLEICTPKRAMLRQIFSHFLFFLNRHHHFHIHHPFHTLVSSHQSKNWPFVIAKHIKCSR